MVAIFCINYVLIKLIVDLNVNTIMFPQILIVSLIFLTYSKLRWAANLTVPLICILKVTWEELSYI